MFAKCSVRSPSAEIILAGGGAVGAILIAATSLTARQTRIRVEETVLARAHAQARSISKDITAKVAEADSSA